MSEPAQKPDARVIDGKAVAARLAEKVKKARDWLVSEVGKEPGLAVILVGNHPASEVYVRSKGSKAEECGIQSRQYTLPTDTSQAELLTLIGELNSDAGVHGILVQLPLPGHIDKNKIIAAIDPVKDVDGFHPINVGMLAAGAPGEALVPCTPAACVLLVKSALGDDLSGLEAVIVGRSNIVGKPVALLLLQENCTVTIAHSRTRDLPAVCRRADILVAAVGRPQMIRSGWIKPGACIIDVGINRVPAPEKSEGKTRIVGDVAFDEAVKVAGSITPVPGGVGPMTIAMLMANTVIAAARAADRPDIANSVLQD